MSQSLQPALVADLGGTRIKLGVVRGREVLSRDVIDARSDHSLAERLPVIEKALRRCADRAAVDIDGCAGVAFGYPSLIDATGERIVAHSGKFADAPELDLVGWARDSFGLPFAVDNDARGAMFGEWQYGAGAAAGSPDMVMITLGTGIGTAVVMGGRPLRGVGGDAGNYGSHMRYDVTSTIRCHCGVVGCYEACAGSWTLDRRARAMAGFGSSALGALTRVDYAAVFREAAAGDAVALELRDRAIETWGDLAIALLRAYSPELIVFGGGIMASGSTILPPIQEMVEAVAQIPSQRVPVVAASLGDDAALVGLGWYAADHAAR